MKNCRGLNQISLDFVGYFDSLTATGMQNQPESFLWSQFQNPSFPMGFERREGQIDGESQQKMSFCATLQQFALTSD
jgi:hypothetical protein